jgi:hypothetical protein
MRRGLLATTNAATEVTLNPLSLNMIGYKVSWLRRRMR